MKRVRLRYEGVRQIVGSSEDLSIVLLTDEQRSRAISVVCDSAIAHQIMMRFNAPGMASTFLPEALLEMVDDELEIMVYGIHEGQYQVVLADKSYTHSARLRMSDAVLLMVIRPEVPLYIESSLMKLQSVPFDENASGIAIPINTMDNQRLSEALQRAIDTENYELASHIRDEINNRKQAK